MIINNLIRYFSGYVCFEAKNGFVERLINLCSLNNVILWDFKRTEEGFEATTKAKDYKKIKEYAKKVNVQTNIVSKKGFIFKANKYKSRWGLMIGVCFLVLFTILMQNFVWVIDINGNETVNEKTILAELKEVGIHKLSYIPNLDFREKKQQALLRLPQLSWLAINRNGCKLTVDITERKLPPLINENQPCNIVANKTGQIRYMEVYSGTKVVNQSYTVKEGDIIVSNEVQDKKGNVKHVHADAKIIAEVQFDKKISIDINQVSKEYTGKEKNRHYLNLFDVKIPLFIATKVKGNFDVSTSDNMIHIFGKEFPIGIYSMNYKFYNKKNDSMTIEDAKKLVEKAFMQYEATELDNSAILKKEAQEQILDGVYTMKMSYTVEQDIARKVNVTN